MRRVGVVLPAFIELPGQYDPLWRLVRRYPTGVALLAVNAKLVPATADLLLHDEVGHRRRTDLIVLWPPGAELGREHLERELLRCSNGNRPAYHRIDVLRHLFSPIVCFVAWSSTAAAKAASAASH